MILEHATCIEVEGVGVLLRGDSGSGKSDLALRLIDGGARLVSDDYVEIAAHGDRLLASAPERIAGLIEVRGLGLIRTPHVTSCSLGLVVDLVGTDDVPRLPVPERVDLDGISILRLRVAPFEVSACAKVRLAVRALDQLAGVPR